MNPRHAAVAAGGWLLIGAASFAQAPAADTRGIDVGLDPTVELEAVERIWEHGGRFPHAAGPVEAYFNGIESDLSGGAGGMSGTPARAEAVPSDPGLRQQILARLGPPPALAVRDRLSDWLVAKAGGSVRLNAWVDSLRSFALRTRFMEVYAARAPLLDPLTSGLRRECRDAGFLPKLEDYTGLRFDGEYRIVVSPFCPTAINSNAVVFETDGAYRITSVLGTGDSGTLDDDLLRHRLPAIAWHELSHGLLDTLADLHTEEISRSAGMFSKLPLPCYGDWEQCVKETVVRAVMIRLIAINYGVPAAARRLKEENPIRFPYLVPMLERLQDYERHRDQYPSLSDFYPRLIAVLPSDAPPRGSAGASHTTDALLGPFSAFSTPGQRRRALRYMAALKNEAVSPQDLFKAGALRFLMRDDAGAAADCSSALALEPSSPGCHLLRSLAERDLGRAEAARADLAAARSECRQPGIAAASSICGDYRLEAAARAVGRTGSPPLDPAVLPDAPDPARPTAEFFKKRAVARYLAHDAMGALSDVGRALLLQPDDPETLMNQAVIFDKMRRRRQALKSYDEGLASARRSKKALAPEFLADLYSSRASLWIEDGMSEKAKKDLELALACAPAGWPRRGETQRALAHLEASPAGAP